jgi:superfamily II RNA helicase
MPCKTTIFAGDAAFLNAMNYRQMSGRAGRRGFDLLGHVIFFCVPAAKVKRLITSQLANVLGNLPLTISLYVLLLLPQERKIWVVIFSLTLYSSNY